MYTIEESITPRKISDMEMSSKTAHKLGRDMAKLQGMAKGGAVRVAGKRTLHKGEVVARKPSRTKSRNGGR